MMVVVVMMHVDASGDNVKKKMTTLMVVIVMIMMITMEKKLKKKKMMVVVLMVTIVMMATRMMMMLVMVNLVMMMHQGKLSDNKLFNSNEQLGDFKLSTNLDCNTFKFSNILSNQFESAPVLRSVSLHPSSNQESFQINIDKPFSLHWTRAIISEKGEK
jgi:hypothetical protein